jgi:diaminopimelate epimerase
MEMYNIDGSRGAMCGNGIRCVAKYVLDHKVVNLNTNVLKVETDVGVKSLIVTGMDHQGKITEISVDMGQPGL